MSWFDNLIPRIKTRDKTQQVPDGLWLKCAGCDHTLYRQDAEKNQMVCPHCGHHMRIKARQRLLNLFDKNCEKREIGKDLQPADFLKFKDQKRYKDRIAAAQKKSNENDALIVMEGDIFGRRFTAAAFEFEFMGDSMGSVVGEKFVRGVENAILHETPFICFAASGGARMQEGLTSLMQMAKTSAALTELSKSRLPFISVLTDPTMGGVSASFAMLGDVIVAEPNALIGFAGPRVIEQTVREKLPEGFQRSEFLLKTGAIDCIISRKEMRIELAKIAAMLMQQTAPDITDEEPITTPQPQLPAPEDKVEEKAVNQAANEAEKPSETVSTSDKAEEQTQSGEVNNSAEQVVAEPADTDKTAETTTDTSPLSAISATSEEK